MLSKKIIRFRSGVYKITNLTNGKIYIGSSVNIYNRKHTHTCKLNKNTHVNKHLQNSYNKYGGDNFLFEVLEYCNIESIELIEQFYISRENPSHTYNHRAIAQNNIGLKVSDKTKNKISATLKNRYEKGEIKAYNQSHKFRVVEQYDLKGNFIKSFKNPKEAENYLSMNIHSGGVAKAAKSFSIHQYGFQWKYKDSNKIIRKYIGANSAKTVKVTNIITNKFKIFSSLAEFCRFKNFSKSSISKVILRKNNIFKNTYLIEYISSPV